MISFNNIHKQLNKDGIIITNVSGNSMSPFLKDQTKVTISKPKDIKLYDVVLYQNKDKYVLHRVIDIKDSLYTTKGDNYTKTESISKDKIIGVLIGYYKKNEYIEINDSINKRFYNISKVLSPFIHIRVFIKSLFK